MRTIIRGILANFGLQLDYSTANAIVCHLAGKDDILSPRLSDHDVAVHKLLGTKCAPMVALRKKVPKVVPLGHRHVVQHLLSSAAQWDKSRLVDGPLIAVARYGEFTYIVSFNEDGSISNEQWKHAAVVPDSKINAPPSEYGLQNKFFMAVLAKFFPEERPVNIFMLGEMANVSSNDAHNPRFDFFAHDGDDSEIIDAKKDGHYGQINSLKIVFEGKGVSGRVYRSILSALWASRCSSFVFFFPATSVQCRRSQPKALLFCSRNAQIQGNYATKRK